MVEQRLLAGGRDRRTKQAANGPSTDVVVVVEEQLPGLGSGGGDAARLASVAAGGEKVFVLLAGEVVDGVPAGVRIFGHAEETPGLIAVAVRGGELRSLCICRSIAIMHIQSNVVGARTAYTAATIGDVTDNFTPLRPVRVEDDLWREFGQLVGERRRSAVIRDFIRWYVGEKGARLPARPDKVATQLTGWDPKVIRLLKRARNDLAHPAPGASMFSSEKAHALSPVELQVLVLVADDLTETEIAEALEIGARTVKSHVKNIADKLQAAGRPQIYVPAIKPED